MAIVKGNIVKSISGRDAGRFYLVLDLDEKTALIADGKVRPLEKPKKKNLKHLRRTNTVVVVEEYSTDKKLRHLLHPFNYPTEN